MQDRIKAIDFIYYVATPEFIGKWNVEGLGLKADTKRKLLRENAIGLFRP
jgi:hypothetical protein